jgi:hypothetical protein
VGRVVGEQPDHREARPIQRVGRLGGVEPRHHRGVGADGPVEQAVVVGEAMADRAHAQIRRVRGQPVEQELDPHVVARRDLVRAVDVGEQPAGRVAGPKAGVLGEVGEATAQRAAYGARCGSGEQAEADVRPIGVDDQHGISHSDASMRALAAVMAARPADPR